MNKRILIVHFCLTIGGGERLVYELAKFAINNSLKPTVLIPNNYATEYYDALLKEIGVQVVRTRLDNFKLLRNPANLFKAIYWRCKLRYFAARSFRAIHIINLGFADQIKGFIYHPNQYYWHIGNIIQFEKEVYPFSKELLNSEDANIVYVNEYQLKEIQQQYGPVRANQILFKLFSN